MNGAGASLRRHLLSPGFATIFLAAAVVIVAGIYWTGRAPSGYDVAVAGGPYPVGGKEVTQVVWAAIQGTKADSNAQKLSLETTSTTDGTTTTRVRLPRAGNVAIDISVQNGPPVHRNIRVESLRRLVFAALLFLGIALLIPYSLLRTGGPTTPWGPWYGLLSEAGGGYSLARVQLLIWFLPSAVLYAALSFTLQSFADVTSEIGILLGLAGATTMLGTAASPSESPRSSSPVPPDLTDLVTDWNAHGDLSRYQYLLLSIVGVLVMVAAFWRQLEFPSIPAQFLYLLVGSQGTYIATKAVKTAKGTDVAGPSAGMPIPPTAPRPAPATMSPAPSGVVPDATGSFQPAVK